MSTQYLVTFQCRSDRQSNGKTIDPEMRREKIQQSLDLLGREWGTGLVKEGVFRLKHGAQSRDVQAVEVTVLSRRPRMAVKNKAESFARLMGEVWNQTHVLWTLREVEVGEIFTAQMVG